ncbi:MAG: hypothetical protein HGA31_03055 [Candidatus Moranbacteria bacterium]|nr:hypothetical protein [Candidatus Moranbacteria bacterium]
MNGFFLLAILSIAMFGSPTRLGAETPLRGSDTSVLFRKPAELPLNDFVVDSAGLIPARDRDRMKRELRKLFANRKRELVVVTVKSMDNLAETQAVFDSFQLRTSSPIVLVVTPYPNTYLTAPESMLPDMGPVREKIRVHIHGEKRLSDAIVKSCGELIVFLNR